MSIDEARAACEAAGFPLRDRYGMPAPDAWVAFVIRAVTDAEALDVSPDRRLEMAATEIGLGFVLGFHGLAGGIDTPTDEEYEMGIVTALRGAL